MAHSRRRALSWITAAVLAVAGAGAAAAVAAPSGLADPVTATTVLPGDVVPQLGGARDLGRTDPHHQVNVVLTLNRPRVAAEKALWDRLYTPGSSDYHHFLSPAEFDRVFGVAPAVYAGVGAWATRDGLELLNAAGSRDVLQLSGTVEQVERTFHVTMHDFQDRHGTRFFANLNPPTVPAGHSVQGLIGLNSYYRSHVFPTRAHARPSQDTCVTFCTGLTTPQDLWSAYDMPGGATADPRGNLKVDFGQGQQMAIFGEGQSTPTVLALRSFEKLHKLPTVPVTVVRTDGTKADYSDSAGGIEWNLDTQSSTGMAPDVRRLVMYFGKNLTDASVLGVFTRWADDPNGPLQASASYGECEENPISDAQGANGPYPYAAGAMYTVKSEDILRKATIEGRTLFSSSGDTGGTCPLLPVNINGVGYEQPGVGYPASSPYVVGVGGTVLYLSASSKPTRQVEYGWTYGGGGTSLDFVEPSYQKGISAISGICTYGPGGSTAGVGQTCRGTPDIAAQSGDVISNGYGIVANGESNYPGGGTSLSSPLSLGMWTRIQAAAPGVTGCSGSTTFNGLGFANPVLYRQFKSSEGSRDFFDIGGGAPTSPPSTNVPYPSTPGWDYQSGMGVMDVSNLIRDITHSSSLAAANPQLPKPPSATGATVRANACTPLFTDFTGDDAFIGDPNGQGSNPQLDIVAGNLDTLTVGGQKILRTVLVIKNLSKAPAQAGGAANEYYFVWTYKGTQYFSNVEVDSVTGAVTYNDGAVQHVGSSSQFQNNNTDSGQFVPGALGRVVVDVPLANVGNPPTGAVLSQPVGETDVLVGSPAVGGSLQPADNAGPHFDYTVGQACSTATGIAAAPYAEPVSDAALRYNTAGAPPAPAVTGPRRTVKRCARHSSARAVTAGVSNGRTGSLADTGASNQLPALALLPIAAGIGLIGWRVRLR